MPRRRQTHTRPAAPNGNQNGGSIGSSGGNHHHNNQNENHQPPHHHHHSHHHRPRHHHQHQNNNNHNNNFGNSNYQQSFQQQRRQQQHDYYQQSDHDAVAASAVLAYRNDTRSSLNLPVIRRHIPTAKRVVSMAAYVTVYKISATSGQWDKPDIEGPLFILEVDTDNNNDDEEGDREGDGDGGGGAEDESGSDSRGGDRKWKKLTTRYQIFVMNRKGICSLLIPLPRKPENLDAGNSELISILVDETSTAATKNNKRSSMDSAGGTNATGDNSKRSTSKNRSSGGEGGGGKMEFNKSDEKGKSVECYGLRIYSEEGTSTEGDRQRIGEELLALVSELKEEELLAARLAEEAKAEMERQRILEEEREAAAVAAATAAAQQMAMMQQQQVEMQQYHHHHAAAVGMARSQSTFRDMGGSYREPMGGGGRRITLAELFGQSSAGGGIGGGGLGLDPMSGFRDKEYDEVPGPVPMGFSYTHM